MRAIAHWRPSVARQLIEKSSRYTFTFAVVSQRFNVMSTSRAVCEGIVPIVPVSWNHVPIGGLLRLATFGVVFRSLMPTARLLPLQVSGSWVSMYAQTLTVLPCRFMLETELQRGNRTPAVELKNELNVSDAPELPRRIWVDVLKMAPPLFCHGSGVPLSQLLVIWAQLFAVPLLFLQRP